jgi:hypothetical protein
VERTLLTTQVPFGIEGTSAPIAQGALVPSMQDRSAYGTATWCENSGPARFGTSVDAPKATHLRPLGLLGGTSG